MKKPYLTPNRLNDLIAAIPVLAINDSYKNTAKVWTKIITGIGDNSEYWENIFEDHSEFFRKTLVEKDENRKEDGEWEQDNQLDESGPKYSLVMRRGVSSRYHKVWKKIVSTDEYFTLSDADRKKLTRSPLSDSQMKMLIDLAITLHSQAIAAEQDKRFWISPALSVFGLFGGAILGHHFGSK
jgi:hypothetical protein